VWAGGLGGRRRLGACPTKPDGVPAWRELLGAFVYSGGVAPAYRHAERRLGRHAAQTEMDILAALAGVAIAAIHLRGHPPSIGQKHGCRRPNRRAIRRQRSEERRVGKECRSRWSQ